MNKNEHPAIVDDRAPEAGTPKNTKRNNAFDYDRHIVDRVDESIWSALYAGHFRLATRCLRCGRWLVDGQSKRRHYGAVCALKAATEGSAQ